MNQLRDFMDHFSKEFFIGCSILGAFISLKFIEIDNLYSFVPISIFFILFLIILIAYKNPKFDLSSTKWFNSIIEELNSTSNVIIYLKDFCHPDDTNDKHRNEILKIMSEFARLIYEYRDSIKIMAYRPKTQRGPCPREWLIKKILELDTEMDQKEAEKFVDQSVFLIQKQMISNKYTFYLFDEKKLLYSIKKENNNKYFSMEMENSVIPLFLSYGFKTLNNKNGKSIA